jgi:proton glutamate symport protein
LTKLKLQTSSSLLIGLLRNPWTILCSALLAMYIGVSQPDFAKSLAPLGNIYLSLLKMCVLPILISAITMSIGKLMVSNDAVRYIKRVLSVFPIGMLIVSLVGLVTALIFGPGRSLSSATLQKLGVLINKEGVDLVLSLSGPPLPPKEPPGLLSFIISMIPSNIFGSLSEGETLKVVFFSIVFGATLGIVNRNASNPYQIFNTFEAIYKSFNKMIGWLTLILPFGLFSLLASQIAKAGLNVIFAMVSFLLAGLLAYAIVYMISTLVIWSQVKRPLSFVFATLQDTSILALATSNAFACLPSTISAMSDVFKFERQAINVVVPLAVTVGRFGQIVYFALASLFVAQLYKSELGVGSLSIVIVGSIFAGIASSGATGIATLATMNVVLQPLGLPLEAVLVLFFAIDPIMDPFRTLCTLHTGIAATTVIADMEPNQQVLEEDAYLATS